MAVLIIKRYKYHDAKLHWEKYEERFINKYRRIYSQCEEAGVTIDFSYNPNDSMMTVSVIGDSLEEKEVLIDQIRSLDYQQPE